MYIPKYFTIRLYQGWTLEQCCRPSSLEDFRTVFLLIVSSLPSPAREYIFFFRLSLNIQKWLGVLQKKSSYTQHLHFLGASPGRRIEVQRH